MNVYYVILGFLLAALLFVLVALALGQDQPGWWPGPAFCDDPNGSPTGTGWRPALDSPAGSPFKYKDLFENWQDPVDINGNPIAPEDYYIGACPPKRSIPPPPAPARPALELQL